MGSGGGNFAKDFQLTMFQNVCHKLILITGSDE